MDSSSQSAIIAVLKAITLMSLPIAAHLGWTLRFLTNVSGDAQAAARQESGNDMARRIASVRKIRWALTLSYLAQVLAAGIGMSFLREAGLGHFTQFALLAPILLAHWQIKFHAERKVRGLEASHAEYLRMNLVGFVSAIPVLVMPFYIHVISDAFVAFGTRFGLDEDWLAAFDYLGIAVGLLTAMYMMFLSAPYALRKLLPTGPITNAEKRDTIERCFHRAGLQAPQLWMLHMDRFKVHNAIVTGLSGTLGWFRPAMFITRSLFQVLDEEEFEAVMLHEVAHVKLDHMKRRLWFGFFVGASSTFIAISMLYMSLLVLDLKPGWFILSTTACTVIGAMLLPFLLPYHLVRKRVQEQEFEADAYAVFRLGARLDALERALIKLDALNDQSTASKSPESRLSIESAHPTTKVRLIALRRQQQAHRATGKSAA